MSPDDVNLVLIATVWGGVVLATLWLALVIWAYRDMRARSRDTFAQILVAVVVAALNVPGVFIYVLLRPRETLSEAYERSLEEEALLQEIEEKPTCPGCGQRVQDDWQACAYCHTRLHKSCINCGRMLELSWNLCPHCATGQTIYQTHHHYETAKPDLAPSITVPEQWLTESTSPPTPQDTGSAGALEFVETDDY
jgi:RNA polymerase subunit RPABC4/transcription elongation factor Spt4